MRLVDRQVLRDLVGPFLFGVAAFSSVFFAGSYLLKLTGWIMNGMPVLTALQVVLLYMPSIVVYTLPMATLLAVLLAMGRLSGEHEVVALYASGVSIYRIAVPILGLGLAVSASAIILNEVIAPRANLRNQELQAAVLRQTKPADKQFSVYDAGTQSLIDVNGGMDPDTGVMKNVSIYKYTNGRPTTVFYAARGVWSGLSDPAHRYQWRLYDGFSQTIGTDFTVFSTFEKTQTKEIEIQKTPDQLALFPKDPNQMSFTELSRLVKYLETHPDRGLDRIRQLDVDRWNKLSLPISSLVFALLAAPLGIRPQRSASSVGLGLSILVILLYWMVWHYTSSLAVQGNLDPVVGAFLADALGIGAAIGFMKKASK